MPQKLLHVNTRPLRVAFTSTFLSYSISTLQNLYPLHPDAKVRLASITHIIRVSLDICVRCSPYRVLVVIFDVLIRETWLRPGKKTPRPLRDMRRRSHLET